MLAAATLPYGAVVRVRNGLYDLGVLRRHPLPLPSVCVGNLTAGGTGKTPAVAWIAAHYRASGEHVAVVRRGYRKGGSGGPSDETMLLRERIPGLHVIENPDRVAAAREAAEAGATVIVLDDGFQHRRARRDLDIVLIDATDPFGGGHLLPWGMLREPVAGLSRAGVFLLTRCDQATDSAVDAIAERLGRDHPATPIVRSVHGPHRLFAGSAAACEPRPIDTLRGTRVRALSGIGRPDAFVRTLHDLGATVAHSADFPDHHDYTAAEIAELLGTAGDPWVTTEKDWVKIRGLVANDHRLLVLGIDLEIRTGGPALIEALARPLRGV